VKFKRGAKLTVRDTQFALFVNEGKIADVFGPGLYTLSTRTLPLLTNLMNWDKAFASPFKSDVYFFSTREQLDQKWGTSNPITIRDKEMGPIRVRANGSFSYKIAEPKKFFQKIGGARSIYTAAELEGQLRAIILTQMAAHFGGAEVAFIDMAANQTKFSDTLRQAITPALADYGLSLATFFVQSITLPEELQAYFDKAASMRMVGDLGRYTQFQTAESIAVAAANPGGNAGIGAGLGAGMAIGNQMAAAMGNSMAGSFGGANKGTDDAMASIQKLHDLLKNGVLTQAEFDAKKAELLKKIT
jgi:membrane protease subunit (stomatin/prohibitin family)